MATDAEAVSGSCGNVTRTDGLPAAGAVTRIELPASSGGKGSESEFAASLASFELGIGAVLRVGVASASELARASSVAAGVVTAGGLAGDAVAGLPFASGVASASVAGFGFAVGFAAGAITAGGGGADVVGAEAPPISSCKFHPEGQLPIQTLPAIMPPAKHTTITTPVSKPMRAFVHRGDSLAGA